MGLFRWLASLFRPATQVVRDVSSLSGDPARLDATNEVVDLTGGPLKPGHLRRALHDRRLLPKGKRTRHGGLFALFPGDEARRLFADTLRTRNRALRTLLPDEEQLDRLDLPPWRTEADLAKSLGLSVKELRYYAIHRDASRVYHYVTFAIPKRSGGQRQILAPKRKLKAIQRKLRLLVDDLPVSEHAHGFRPGRNTRTNAEPHVGRPVILRLDLQDFFPSVTFGRARGLFVALGYGYAVAATLAALVTESVRQPVEVDGVVYHVPVGPRHCVQGAPTSPGICNALARKLDQRLAGLARAFGFRYTRYADDLTFSGEEVKNVPALKRFATRIIREEGFQVNEKKTHVARRGSRQQVTGVTVNDVAGLSRRERRRLRALLHQLRRQEAAGQLDAARLQEARGRLAYLHMLNAGQAEALRKSGGQKQPEPGA
jgi:retron-type reverse transcriptase